MAVTGLKGKKSLQCGESSFDGADPAPDAKKACFCDKNKKFFDQGFVSATRTFWKAAGLEKQSNQELTRTSEHVSEVVRVSKERETQASESSTSTKVSNEKAEGDIAAAKICAVTGIEEAYKFRKQKQVMKKSTLIESFTKRKDAVSAKAM